MPFACSGKVWVAGLRGTCNGLRVRTGESKTSDLSKRRLPIGTQTFRTVREDNCHYVDKTGFALRLIRDGTHYFLSRPRRFGKGLFVGSGGKLERG